MKDTIVVKLPGGREVELGPKSGYLQLAVDLEMTDKDPAVRDTIATFEMLARRVKAIDGKPPAGKYDYRRLLTDLSDRDVQVLVRAAAELDTPTPEEIAAALAGAGLRAKEAMDEAVALYRLTGGAIPFEQAMEYPEAKRKLMLAAMLPKERAAEESGSPAAEGRE